MNHKSMDGYRKSMDTFLKTEKFVSPTEALKGKIKKSSKTCKHCGK